MEQIRMLVARGDIRISDHGYEELAEDDIFVRDVVGGVAHSECIEEYPDYPKGPCILALQHDANGRAIHAVWGIPRGRTRPAVLVTAYRPNPERWSEDFRRRKT